jgi:SecDF, P1 head subdomain
MGERLVEVLRRRSEAGVSPDVVDSYRSASVAGARRRRRRRVALGAVAACATIALGAAVVAVVATRSDDAQVTIGSHRGGRALSDPGVLQFRPVLSVVPGYVPSDPTTSAPDEARAALAACDVDKITSLGPTIPTTPANEVVPESCVVLEGTDGGDRYLLGPSQLDGAGVSSAKKDVLPGSGRGVELTLTPEGSRSFDALAQQQFHRQVAVVADAKVVAAPTIQPANEAFVPFGNRISVSSGDEAAANAIVEAVHESHQG